MSARERFNRAVGVLGFWIAIVAAAAVLALSFFDVSTEVLLGLLITMLCGFSLHDGERIRRLEMRTARNVYITIRGSGGARGGSGRKDGNR